MRTRQSCGDYCVLYMENCQEEEGGREGASKLTTVAIYGKLPNSSVQVYRKGLHIVKLVMIIEEIHSLFVCNSTLLRERIVMLAVGGK